MGCLEGRVIEQDPSITQCLDNKIVHIDMLVKKGFEDPEVYV